MHGCFSARLLLLMFYLFIWMILAFTVCVWQCSARAVHSPTGKGSLKCFGESTTKDFQKKKKKNKRRHALDEWNEMNEMLWNALSVPLTLLFFSMVDSVAAVVQRDYWRGREPVPKACGAPASLVWGFIIGFISCGLRAQGARSGSLANQ